MSRIRSKEAIRTFLLANIGWIIETRELQEVAGGVVQYSRKLHELRELSWYIL